MRDGITFKRLKESVSVYAEAKDLASFCEKRGLFDDVSHSIYYCFWFSLQCLAISLIKNQRKGLRLVSRAHRYDLFQDANPNNRQPWQRFMRDNCDRLLFLCDSAKEYFTREFGEEVFAGQYKVNGLGVRPSRQSPIRPPSQPPRIVSCSNVLSFKRVDLIAEALGSIPDKRIQWVHFGDGPEKDAIANEARQMQLNASFCGHVSNEDVREYYENNYVDAFVTATSSEGVPVSIQEALSCGIPIIGTDVGGISEQISGNGILLSANPSVESLAWAISEMCDAPLERREAMRNRSRSIWAEKYDLAKNKASLMQILSDLYNTSVN